jgi:nucleoside 2-deoxyribosyltransferase
MGEYLLEQLGRQGLVDLSAQNDDSCDCIITVDGYTHLSDLERHTVNSTQGFVAMWFDDSMAPAAVGIEAAILDAGYKPLRIDGKEHNNKIDDEIIAEIRRSRFLVADFTQGESGARGGVYYEAGFAHGLNIPVIFMCRQDAIAKVHFDTRQYNHITWTTPEDLRLKLSKRISATVGDGPLRDLRS